MLSAGASARDRVSPDVSRDGRLARARSTGSRRRVAARGTVAPNGALRAGVLGLLGRPLLLGHVALVDPDLHADLAERRLGLEEAVVDVRAERVQRNAALAIELGARHLGAAEATRALHADALGAGALRRLHALAHGATERDAGSELLGDALRDELGVHLGVLDLEDVQLNLLAGELLEVGAKLVRLGAAAADDDAGARRVKVDADALARALDLHLGHACALEARRHESADLDVLDHVVAVALALLGRIGEPTRPVIGRDPQAVAARVDFLSHYRAPSWMAASGVATTTVMWHERLRMRAARPWARGRIRFIVGPSSTKISLMTRSRVVETLARPRPP